MIRLAYLKSSVTTAWMYTKINDWIPKTVTFLTHKRYFTKTVITWFYLQLNGWDDSGVNRRMRTDVETTPTVYERWQTSELRKMLLFTDKTYAKTQPHMRSPLRKFPCAVCVSFIFTLAELLYVLLVFVREENVYLWITW